MKFIPSILFATTIAMLSTSSTMADHDSDAAAATTTFDNNDEDHGIYIFECDKYLNELAVHERQVKNQGVPIRICFQPFDDTVSRIQQIQSFTWETDHLDGTAKQAVVSNGRDDGATSMLGCKDEGKLCYLDTFLGSDFYLNNGSVEGSGIGILEIQDKESGSSQRTITVPLQRWIFQAEFNLVMKNGPDGEELSEEDSQILKDHLAAQRAADMAAAAGAAATSAQQFASASEL